MDDIDFWDWAFFMSTPVVILAIVVIALILMWSGSRNLSSGGPKTKEAPTKGPLSEGNGKQHLGEPRREMENTSPRLCHSAVNRGAE